LQRAVVLIGDAAIVSILDPARKNIASGNE